MIPEYTYHEDKKLPVRLALSCGCMAEKLADLRVAYWHKGEVVCYGAVCKAHAEEFNAWPEHEARHAK